MSEVVHDSFVQLEKFLRTGSSHCIYPFPCALRDLL